MPLFGSKQLPATSYGYQPPRDARARGWGCISTDCGAAEIDVPRRWPFACPQCGGPTDPAFAEPWDHEARGAEIQYLLANGRDDGGFTENEWPLWRYRDALRKGDREGASQARADFRILDDPRSGDDGILRGNGYFSLVWSALEAGDLDSAADDLLHWFSLTSPEDVENDNTRRTNCRQVIDSSIRFLRAPGGREHPQGQLIRLKCLQLAAAVRDVLTGDLQNGVAWLSQS